MNRKAADRGGGRGRGGIRGLRRGAEAKGVIFLPIRWKKAQRLLWGFSWLDRHPMEIVRDSKVIPMTTLGNDQSWLLAGCRVFIFCHTSHFHFTLWKVVLLIILFYFPFSLRSLVLLSQGQPGRRLSCTEYSVLHTLKSRLTCPIHSTVLIFRGLR